MDKLSAKQRSTNMAAIRSKDTKPEKIVWRGIYRNPKRTDVMCDGRWKKYFCVCMCAAET